MAQMAAITAAAIPPRRTGWDFLDIWTFPHMVRPTETWMVKTPSQGSNAS